MHYIQIVYFASIEIKVKSATDLWAAILNIYTAEKRSEIIYAQDIRKYNCQIFCHKYKIVFIAKYLGKQLELLYLE